MLLGGRTRRTSSISCAACNSVCPCSWIRRKGPGESGRRSAPARRPASSTASPAPSPFPLANWIRALREAPLEHAFCDPVLEDLDRAAADHPATAAAHAQPDHFLLRLAAPAHHLQ